MHRQEIVTLGLFKQPYHIANGAEKLVAGSWIPRLDVNNRVWPTETSLLCFDLVIHFRTRAEVFRNTALQFRWNVNNPNWDQVRLAPADLDSCGAGT